MNNKSNLLKMADYNVNFARTIIYISVMYFILHFMIQVIHMHMYNSRVHDLFDASKWLP